MKSNKEKSLEVSPSSLEEFHFCDLRFVIGRHHYRIRVDSHALENGKVFICRIGIRGLKPGCQNHCWVCPREDNSVRPRS